MFTVTNFTVTRHIRECINGSTMTLLPEISELKSDVDSVSCVVKDLKKLSVKICKKRAQRTNNQILFYASEITHLLPMALPLFERFDVI